MCGFLSRNEENEAVHRGGGAESYNDITIFDKMKTKETKEVSSFLLESFDDELC